VSSTSTRAGRTGAPFSRRIAPRAGHGFVAAYVVLLIAFGVVPTVYAIYFAFTNAGNRFTGLSNFTAAAADFRFIPAVEHVALYLVFWLAALVVFVVGLALLLHRLAVRGVSRSLRFLYYIPGALAGAASVMVWLFLLDPTVSPIGFLLRALGYDTFGQVIAPGHLAVLFTCIAFWTGAGGWIVVMYGALNNISTDILEAARIDGAGPWRTARQIEIPLLRKWIVYMVILAFAGGTQLFVEPQLLTSTWVQANVPPQWAPNQLAYSYAFDVGNFGAAAALSLLMLGIGLAGGYVLIRWTGFFKLEGQS